MFIDCQLLFMVFLYPIQIPGEIGDRPRFFDNQSSEREREGEEEKSDKDKSQGSSQPGVKSHFDLSLQTEIV